MQITFLVNYEFLKIIIIQLINKNMCSFLNTLTYI